MPWISREEQKQRELEAQRKRRAEDAVSGRIFYPSTPTPTPVKVKPLFQYELFNAEITCDAWQLWHHLRGGQKDTRYGTPTEQTDAQLAETCGVPATTPESIAAVLEELEKKGLIRIQEHQGRRCISTSTARTCGLDTHWISL